MKNITFKQLKKFVTEDINDKELAPCEWCGSDNVSVIEYPTVKIDGKVKAVAYYAQCHSCGRKGETMFKRNEAIEIWNYTMDALANGTYEENSDFGVTEDIDKKHFIHCPECWEEIDNRNFVKDYKGFKWVTCQNCGERVCINPND